MNIKALLYAVGLLLITFILTITYLFYIDTTNSSSYVESTASSSPELYELECREANGWEKFIRRCVGWDN